MKPTGMKWGSVRNVALGVVAGLALLIGTVWVLTLTLGNNPPYLYSQHPIHYWQEQLNNSDVGASNAAFSAVNRKVIPQLLDAMVNDTQDSKLRVALVKVLNGLPGVQIYFTEAGERRALAATRIGQLGPAASSAVPALINALEGGDASVHEAAIASLGRIHSDPKVVIPLLIGYLEDDTLDDEAVGALANYGPLAKAAVPRIIPLLHAADDDLQAAAKRALRRIDPEAYAKATGAGQSGAGPNPHQH